MVAAGVEVSGKEAFQCGRAGVGVAAIDRQQQRQVLRHLVALAHVGVGAGQQGADRLLQWRLRARHDDAALAQRFLDPRQHAVARTHGGGALLQKPLNCSCISARVRAAPQ